MKLRIVLLAITFLGTVQLVPAADLQPARTFHHLEYVHFHTRTQTVEWGVSEGTIDEAGKFVRNDAALATYSINLETGVMTHKGKDGLLSAGEAYGASRAFSALSMLMQGYTDQWVEPNDADVQNSRQDDQTVESDESVGRLLQMIAAPATVKPRPAFSFIAARLNAGCQAAPAKHQFGSQIFSALTSQSAMH